MMISNQQQTSLTRQQKESIALLSIGTFLEYFDFMLYIHMAVLLNELFFPKTNPHNTALISAFAFCSTYLLRPFGAIIFGYIGDNIGRKATVIITTLMMAISCVIMANLPTYEQIGIIATWIISICRIIQGMASMGEMVGAELYLAETVEPPIQYPVVALISVCSVIGGTAALAVASLVTSFGFNWRIAFWIGAGIAVIGAAARTNLRETKEFINAKQQANASLEKNIKEKVPKIDEKINKLTILSLFLISCNSPMCFYFIYIHCANILKISFNYTSEQVIHNNFIVSIVGLIGYIVLTYLSYIIYPLKILKVKLKIFSLFIVVCPYLLTNIQTPLDLLLIQMFASLFFLGTNPALPIFFKYFPTLKRFTYTSVVLAISRTIMYIVTSFSIVYLTEYFNHWGLLIIMTPVVIGFAFGLRHFEKLEIESGNYPMIKKKEIL